MNLSLSLTPIKEKKKRRRLRLTMEWIDTEFINRAKHSYLSVRNGKHDD